MGKYALLVAAALLPCSLTFVGAQAGSQPPTTGTVSSVPVYAVEPPNRVVGYTTWDDDYFYLAVQVNKPTLHGTNSQPFSNPRTDDAVIVTLQTDDDHATGKPTAHTVVVAASAVGGAQLYTGPQQALLFNGTDDFTAQLKDILQNEQDPAKRDLRRTSLLGKLIKFQVTPQSLRRTTGTAMPGYTAEIAVPWSDLGGKPAPGTRMGFNVVAQSTVPDSPALQSLSPQVRDAADVDNPSMWGEIVFSAGTEPSHGAQVVCPRVFSNKPVIDGVVNEGEWNRVAAFSIEPSGSGSGGGITVTQQARTSPTFTPHPSRPPLPLPTPGPLPDVAAHAAQRLPHLVIARYDYRYQADPRKAAPAEGVIHGDGSSALVHHPLEGVGPWFSYDRAGWHRQQVTNARQAGIDVILPVYPGALRDRQRYADKGLLVLITALRSLREGGRDYPQVGLLLDTSDLSATEAAGPLTEVALFNIVRDFYRHIPVPFRFTVPLSAANGGRTACPIFLSGAGALSGFADGWVTRLRARFAQEFDGADLLTLGTADFKAKVAMDGYFADTSDKGFQFIEGGWIKSASVGPGYDPGVPETDLYRPRRNGDTYRTAWAAAISKQPDWVLLDGWNDYTVAAEVAPTFESGYSTADITREYSHRWIGLDRRAVKLLWNDVPYRMAAGQTYTIDVRAQNTGLESWGPPPSQIPAAFAYRWLRGGQAVSVGAGTPLSTPVLNGQDVNGQLAVRAVGRDGAPLPAGDYTLEVGLTGAPKSAHNVTFLSEGTPGSTLQVPVTISTGAERTATLIRSTLPTILESGSVYPARVALRNDGTQAWRKADGAHITFRLYRTELDGIELKEMPVDAADATAMLAEDVLPGQVTEVSVEVPLIGPDAKPLPVWSQDESWTYTVRWEVADNNGGALTAPVAAAVVNFDFGARFVVNGTPAALPAERRLPVRLTLQNDGPRTWVHDAVRVGYHWYYQDGSEFTFDDETTPLKKDVPPGERTEPLLAFVTPPPNDGLYYLVWDLKVGDTWASTTDSSRVDDEIVQTVNIIDGHLSFVDLTTAFNLDGTSDDDAPQDGNFDGEGRAFPAALMPPYAVSSIVPDGAWLSGVHNGPDSTRKISFRWGSKDLKQKNFVVCQGQRIELGKAAATCRKLHILAATTGKDVSTSLKLVFQEPSGESEDLIAFSADRWDQPAAHQDQVAFLARRHNASKGAENGAVALYHYTITINEPGKLKAIELPKESALKIAAITIEK